MKAQFVLKWTGDGRAKARLVLQGFGNPDLFYGDLDISSPTLARTSRQILLALMTCLHWRSFVSDMATTFLQGNPQTRILWAKIPKDACLLIGISSGTLIRLLKPIYGQADVPRRWFKVVQRHFINIGYKPHPLDQCLYFLFDKENLISVIGLHINNLLGGERDNYPRYQEAKKQIPRPFSTASSLRFLSFKGTSAPRLKSW